MEEELTGGRRCLQFFSNYWKTLIVIFVPICLAPIPIIYNGLPFRCMYVVLIMAVYWVTAALPLPVTALIPIVAFPLMSILPSGDVCKVYFESTVVMFFAGLVLALAIEFSNLHKRIALGTIILMGGSLMRLHIGLFSVCVFMSLWIANTAATAMFLPIIAAVLAELEEQGMIELYRDGRKSPTEEEKLKAENLPIPSNVTNCFYLGMAYGATIGGCGTLIGTGTNLILKGIYEKQFPSQEIDFLKFMLYGFPLMVAMAGLTELWLLIFYMGLFRPKSNDAKVVNVGKEGKEVITRVVRDKYEELGKITTHEILVAVCFSICMLLLFTRSPGFTTGWEVISNKKIAGASVAVLFVIIFFILPSTCEWCKFCTKSPDVPRKATQSVMIWSFIHQKIPWGTCLLIGGGFAISEGGKASGMSKMIGEALSVLAYLPPYVILLILIVLVEILTEFSTNTTNANIMLPVLAEMSLAMRVHPIYMMFPVTLACSMAFHMPVGTPPNALVQSFAIIRTQDMAVAGIGPSLISLILIWLWAITIGTIVFPESGSFPDWAQEIVDKSTNAE